MSITETITKMRRIVADDVLSWDDKFDIVFSDAVSGAMSQFMKDHGLDWTYCDPDTSYEEDVMAYVSFVLEHEDRIVRIEEIMGGK